MKVLYISRDLTHMYFHLQYLKELINDGNEVHIACEINKDTNDFVSEGIKLHNIEFERAAITLKHKRAYNQLKDLYKKENFDIIHCNTPIAAFIARLAARKESAKVIYTAHGLHFFKGAPLANWIIYYPLEKIAAKWTDSMILINKEDYEIVKSKFKLRNAGNVFYINGVGIKPDIFLLKNKEDISLKRKELNIKESDLVISIVAELNDNKNQIQLLKAINKSKHKDNIKVLVVGEGKKESELKEFVKENNLNNIEFLGYRRDIPQILSVSDILSLVSKREGLPKSVMEGMASSLAILGTNTRGIRDMIRDGENGFIVEVGDYIELSKKIDKLFEDKVLLSNMKSRSLELSKEYDEKRIIKRLKDIYKEL